jgi:diaminohydroxyphosphoribosylaminopyrimidine deaminase/5-amino-6-(5-phosphoribosylamino)uracil reductase
MRLALGLARRASGRTFPNPPVGAVVVRGGRVLGRGFTRPAGGPHAEVCPRRRPITAPHSPRRDWP